MVLTHSLSSLGEYVLFLGKVFAVPDKLKVFFRRYIDEISKLGIDSIPLDVIISIFIGAVCTIQMELNTSSPLLPRYSVGLATREIILLEFSSSILCLILAGKIGSNISSEIGSMRITEQIDAMEIMGINSANYLILPKIVSSVTLSPLLMLTSFMVGLLGGGLIVIATGVINLSDYITGLQFSFNSYYIVYSMIKMSVFAYIITSVASYWGYYAKGGSLGVGKSSTIAIVASSLLILIFNLVLTHILL